MYVIEYAKPARRSLRSMPVNVRLTIEKKIMVLANNPYAPNSNVKKLQGREGFRLRVGDWRVLYTIENKRMIIYIVDILARGGAYQV